MSTISIEGLTSKQFYYSFSFQNFAEPFMKFSLNLKFKVDISNNPKLTLTFNTSMNDLC